MRRLGRAVASLSKATTSSGVSASCRSRSATSCAWVASTATGGSPHQFPSRRASGGGVSRTPSSPSFMCGSVGAERLVRHSSARPHVVRVIRSVGTPRCATIRCGHRCR
jgi:hypothetical protein